MFTSNRVSRNRLGFSVLEFVILGLCWTSSPSDAQVTMTDWEVHNSPPPAHVETDPKLNPDSEVEQLLIRFIPHPYLSLGPSVLGGGYAPLAYHMEGGIRIDSRRWIINTLAGYDDGHKTNDGTGPNPNGHDRYLNGGIYYRLAWLPSQLGFLGSPNNWFLGGGYTWNQLSTTNYTKGGNRPLIGGGYDLARRACTICPRDFSMRIKLDWVMAGNDWQNGSHGPSATMTMPSPRERRHWFAEFTQSVYRFHQTVTEPYNTPLTQFQRSKKYFDGFATVGIVYRF